MRKECVGWGCSNMPKDGLSFHSFPKDDDLRWRVWVKAVESTRTFWKGPSKHTVICSDHFEDDCFEQTYKIKMSLGFPAKRTWLQEQYQRFFRGLLQRWLRTFIRRNTRPQEEQQKSIRNQERETKGITNSLFHFVFSILYGICLLMTYCLQCTPPQLFWLNQNNLLVAYQQTFIRQSICLIWSMCFDCLGSVI